MIRTLLAALALAGAALPAWAQDMAGMDMSRPHGMTGALGGYAMTRDASGTAWQPDASEHAGIHIMRGEWMFMVHALANGVYDWQGGPRGDRKAFVSGMLMGMARRTFDNGDALQFRAMLSPDAFMGPSGYPLLLQTGETADGKTPLVDRQHPHDLFMELSTSYSHRLSDADSLFVYAGLPGEPAFGPPAFMHRLSIMDSPEAPISHHWLDSDHITFGVLTTGLVHGDWKLEVSRFKGREPDQHRFDIESPKLDSTAARISWNPSANWSLQASWAEVISPEQLEPELNQRRWSASAIYTRPFGDGGWWSTTAAWGQRTSPQGDLPAWVLESAIKPSDAWTVFARAERVDNDELLSPPVGVAPVFTVGKVSVGAIHDWRLAQHLKVGLGALYAWNFVPSGLAAAYGSDDPQGAMGFVRLKID
ncbi:MAG: hypothetical protein E7812_09865 [Phenylobacterium sp.]|nr:MAG: hypothetical protein E7812_09865 [Phenylobacterium sp.]